MEEGRRVCLVHGGAASDGGGSSTRRRRCRRPSSRSQLAQKEACARKHTEGGHRGAGGRNGRGGGPSSGGKHAAAMGGDRGVGSACESAGGAGHGAAPGRAAKSQPLAKDFRPEERGWEGEKWWRARALTSLGRARAGMPSVLG